MSMVFVSIGLVVCGMVMLSIALILDMLLGLEGLFKFCVIVSTILLVAAVVSGLIFLFQLLS